MYLTLAAGNVKKSYRDYSIYFVTLAFSVCLFYTFHSFEGQQNAIYLNDVQLSVLKNMGVIMDILSVFVTFVFGFLIVYANRFLIRRRQKELGIYQILGMRKMQISKILTYETLMVGAGALGIGLLLGVIASQAMIYGTVRMFGLANSYAFLFSPPAAVKTLLSFAGIFLVVILLNLRSLKKYKLIDFWQAQSKNEGFSSQSTAISLLCFLLAIASLWGCYTLSSASVGMLLYYLWPIVLLGALGTLLLIISLSGLLVGLTRCGKAFYYRKLNMFVLRQLSSKIRTTYWTMTFVCILEVLAIGAFATGVGASVGIQRSMQRLTPYDYSYTAFQPNGRGQKEMESILSQMDGIGLCTCVKLYDSDCKMERVLEKMDGGHPFQGSAMEKRPVAVIKLTDMNKILVTQGKRPMQLGDGETALFTDMDSMEKRLDSIEKGTVFQLFGTSLKLKDSDPFLSLSTTSQSGQGAVFVVNDEVVPSGSSLNSVTYNINLKEGASAEEFRKGVNDKIQKYNKQWGKKEPNRISGMSDTRQQVLQSGKEVGVLMAYIGFYLGVVFLISSAVVLALQQLSEASDNRTRYQVLNKLGVSREMRNQSILLQISAYFFLPLALAAVHGTMGLRMMNRLMMAMGASTILDTALLTSAFIFLIYGLYFFITYKGYQQILKQSQNLRQSRRHE